jgi:predicted permease
VFCGIVFGFAPALQVQPRSTARASGVGSPNMKLRYGLVTIQIAASIVLITAAGLLLQTLWKLQAVPLGMDTQRVVTASVVLGQRYDGNPSRLAFVTELESRIASVAGSRSFGIADTVPLLPGGNAFRFLAALEVAGRPRATEGTGGNVSTRAVTEGYFAALGIPVLRGRVFTSEDRRTRNDVLVVNEALVKRLFQNDDPIGKQMRWNTDDPWRTIVGVVGNVKNNPDLSGSDDPEFYLPYPQSLSRRVTVVLRTDASATVAGQSIRSIISSIDSALPVTVQTMTEQVRKLADRPRFAATLLSFFSTVALALAAIGLFATISFLVSRRTQEIGVRMALGATAADIVSLVLSQTMRWIVFGIVLGLTTAWFVAQTLSRMLFQISPRDPVTFGLTVAILAITSIAAAWLPSRRAARVDPIQALRQDG